MFRTHTNDMHEYVEGLSRVFQGKPSVSFETGQC
jgi:hypothetical protein